MPTVVDFAKLREQYAKKLTDSLGMRRDYALRMEQVEWLVRFLDESKPRRILELGCGFSTAIFASWCSENDAWLHSYDHHPQWLSYISELLVELVGRRALLCVNLGPIIEFYDGQRACRYNLAFVDHGPTMETRVQDIPLIATSVFPGGTIIFDDFRKTTRFGASVAQAVSNVPGCGPCIWADISGSRTFGVVKK